MTEAAELPSLFVMLTVTKDQAPGKEEEGKRAASGLEESEAPPISLGWTRLFRCLIGRTCACVCAPVRVGREVDRGNEEEMKKGPAEALSSQ